MQHNGEIRKRKTWIDGRVSGIKKRLMVIARAHKDGKISLEEASVMFKSTLFARLNEVPKKYHNYVMQKLLVQE